MSIDKYQPHLLVLPEDDANRQVAIGFLLDPSLFKFYQRLEDGKM
ncbi:hypothetical protein ACKFKG_30775 [Phormidesmis sp. 146-35]